jgi:hypothetical protein
MIYLFIYTYQGQAAVQSNPMILVTVRSIIVRVSNLKLLCLASNNMYRSSNLVPQSVASVMQVSGSLAKP